MRVLLQTPPPVARAGLAAPLPVVTAWGAPGALGAAILIASILAGAAGCALAARDAVPLRATLAASLLALAAAAAWPVVFSSDVYAYAVYGERAARGIDPYVPRRLDRDIPLERAAAGQWGDPPPRAVYGPAFVAAASIAAPFARVGVARQLGVLRLVEALALAGAAVAVARLMGGVAGRRAAALFALNPAVVWAAAEGHNDILAIAAVACGAAAFRRGRPIRALLILIGAVWTKATAVLPAAVIAWQSATGWTSPRGVIALSGPRARAAFVVTAGLAGYAPLLWSLRSDPPGPASAATFSLADTIATLAARAGTAQPAAHVAGVLAALAAAAGVATAAFRSARRGRPGALTGGALGIWLAVPNVYPWYGAWLALAAALEAPSAFGAAAATATIAGLLRYVADASQAATLPVDPALGVGTFIPPVLVLALVQRKTS